MADDIVDVADNLMIPLIITMLSIPINTFADGILQVPLLLLSGLPLFCGCTAAVLRLYCGCAAAVLLLLFFLISIIIIIVIEA